MIKVADVAFVRFRAPDLDRMQQFLEDFGLVVAERTADRLYARGSGPSPWLHVTERGEPGFAGVAFEAASANDLERAATLEGASAVEPLDGPGGGRRVRFTDPDGFPVEVVHGRTAAEPLPTRRAQPRNTAGHRGRLRQRLSFERGPARVERLGHCVVRVSDFRASEAWYKSRFGFLTSDEVFVGDPEKVVTAFMRCDRGETPTDHHTFLCVGLGEPGFEHAAFEVEDVDAVMLGHEHLAAEGYAHAAGIGRHILGSQVFDYWRDPWGHVLEHFADGDLLDASAEAGQHEPGVALGTWWGRFGPAA